MPRRWKKPSCASPARTMQRRKGGTTHVRSRTDHHAADSLAVPQGSAVAGAHLCRSRRDYGTDDGTDPEREPVFDDGGNRVGRTTRCDARTAGRRCETAGYRGEIARTGDQG